MELEQGVNNASTKKRSAYRIGVITDVEPNKRRGIYLIHVNIGEGQKDCQIVTQYANVAVGQHVIVAPEGSCLAGQPVQRMKVRGEWSEAILCGPSELHIPGDTSQCVVLDKMYKAGEEAPALLCPAEAMVETFSVTVTTMSGDKTIAIEGLVPHDSLGLLRFRLAEQLQIKSARLQFLFGESILNISDGSKSLADLGIDQHAEVSVVISSFDASKIQRENPPAENYCFHEGSYGHNPEGCTMTLLKYDDIVLWHKSSFWEYMVGDRGGLGRTPTGGEGENHEASLSEDNMTLTVITEDLDTGHKTTERFSIMELITQRGVLEAS